MGAREPLPALVAEARLGCGPERPRLAEPVVQEAERRVVPARDGDEGAIGAGPRVQPHERPALRHARRCDAEREPCERLPRPRPRLDAPPPTSARSASLSRAMSRQRTKPIPATAPVMDAPAPTTAPTVARLPGGPRSCAASRASSRRRRCGRAGGSPPRPSLDRRCTGPVAPRQRRPRHCRRQRRRSRSLPGPEPRRSGLEGYARLRKLGARLPRPTGGSIEASAPRRGLSPRLGRGLVGLTDRTAGGAEGAAPRR